MAQDSKSSKGLIERMFDVGAHFGYTKSRRHPSTAPFIFGSKNRNQIINLEDTEVQLARAKGFLEELGKRGGLLLLVGGKHEARDAIKEEADKHSLPYVAGRWIGGTLTNFSEIKKRLDRLAGLLKDRETGALDKYTKKERLMIDREIDRLLERFGGISTLPGKIPDELLVVDLGHEAIAVAEAISKGVPVVGLANVDCDISNVEYPIVANDANRKSINFFLSELLDAYQVGLNNKPQATSNEQPTTQNS